VRSPGDNIPKDTPLPKPKEKQVTKHLADHMIKDNTDPVVEILSPHAKTDLQIRKGFEGLGKNYIVLVLVDANKYQETVDSLLKKFSLENTNGLYITINKPAKTLLKNWSKRKIPFENIQIIDSSSRMTGVSSDPITNVDYLDSPADLTELILAADKKLRLIKNNPFIILDSVTTLLVYNEANAVEKFTHSLMGKIEETESKGVLIMLESEQFREIIQTLSQFCDRVIDMA